MSLVVHVEITKICSVVNYPGLKPCSDFLGVFIDPTLGPGVNFANSGIDVRYWGIEVRVANFFDYTGFVVIHIVYNKANPFIVRPDDS